MSIETVTDSIIGEVQLHYYSKESEAFDEIDTTQTYGLKEGQLAFVGGEGQRSIVATLNHFRLYRSAIKSRKDRPLTMAGASEFPCKLCGDPLQIYGFISDPGPWAHVECIERFIDCSLELSRRNSEQVMPRII